MSAPSDIELVPPNAAHILAKAIDLIDEAAACGVVLAIDQKPLQPLAMGNFKSVPRVWLAKSAHPAILTHGAQGMKDFTPTKETISLHGLGFIQLVLPGDQRMHVWHPDLPRRDCYRHSAIHNHRFSFTSRVLKGAQRNVRVDIELAKELAKDGSHTVISHNGPRSDKGGRLSYPVAECNVFERPLEEYGPGDEYFMPALEYHHTPVDVVVVTVIRKHESGAIHANSIITKGVEFHYDFDRFQLTPEQLFAYVVDALGGAR
jgi:hypothetical protein